MLPLNAYFRLNNLGRNSYKDKKRIILQLYVKEHVQTTREVS